jgi:hypothetical protein
MAAKTAMRATKRVLELGIGALRQWQEPTETSSNLKGQAISCGGIIMEENDVKRLETPRQAVCPALLAADERVHDMHAG